MSEFVHLVTGTVTVSDTAKKQQNNNNKNNNHSDHL